MSLLVTSAGRSLPTGYADSAATDLSSPRPTTFCSFCHTDFSSESLYKSHQEHNNSGCAEHGKCFPASKNYDHAKTVYHTRCFVPGCNSIYADEDRGDKDIVAHVGEEHDEGNDSD